MRFLTRSSLALPLTLTAAAVPLMWWLVSPAAAFALVALVVLEIAMSIDSSVPMAGIAARLHAPARRVFLSVGLVTGVLVMRLLLPPAAVAVSQAESPADAVTEALVQPALFNEHLGAARPGLAAFGAVFIWLVFTEYLFNIDRAPRPHPWLGRLEAAAARVNRPRIMALGSAVVIASLMSALAPPNDQVVVGVASVTGTLTYLGMRFIGQLALKGDTDAPWRLHVYAATVVFQRALAVFMLFEILDGVYTLSSTDTGLVYLEQAAIAALGVGIGAVYLTRLTSRIDSTNGLSRLRHLKAGAAYVLGVLAVLLWASLIVPIPAGVVGWFGTAIIGAALLTSLPWQRPKRLLTR
ncbi:hypothetical protein AC792_09800 [Arthrobacter sp. RIT-PI-e]|uniref:DUF475 domain-containing protein n=1 Tax=Arthrobacter sp. RIT-PI-e TaxID=1681197 RepID=UPI0006767C48|nr:DUF475 domain-containing protein [Arthrobacter sp. RIT-PI-e]KNC18841.1 hypothetical protein AC792_09800 [Arthrobacter sp. RIT-PI-e]